MTHRLEDLNRRSINLGVDKVDNALPEYFPGEYDKLVTFLDKYYEYLDSDNFGKDIRSIHSSRDIIQTTDRNLDQLVGEIGNGLQVASFFANPRLVTKLIATFYRLKGSLVTAEAFFRTFFNEEVTIEYPKEKMFIVGESQVGYESQRFIQDDELYQVFSILVKVGLSVSDYLTLYKRFVHPAGWHFAGQVQTESTVALSITATSDSVGDGGGLIFAGEAQNAVGTGFNEITTLFRNDSGVRGSLTQTMQTYQELSPTELENFYSNVAEIITPNSFTMDDSATISPDTTLTTETMDNAMFTQYNSDSAI